MGKTIFCDLDGTLIKHYEVLGQQALSEPELLPGVREMLSKWDRDGCRLIITTGRREYQRKETEEQLKKLGIPYDMLIMGISGAKRLLINDKSSKGEIRAEVINLDRNAGFSEDQICNL